MGNAQPISILQSLTAFSEQRASDALLVQKGDTFSSRFSKLTIGMVSFGFIGLIGLIETLFRGAIYALLTSLSLTLPVNASTWMQQTILIPLKDSVDLTLLSTKNSFAKIVTNFSIQT